MSIKHPAYLDLLANHGRSSSCETEECGVCEAVDNCNCSGVDTCTCQPVLDALKEIAKRCDGTLCKTTEEASTAGACLDCSQSDECVQKIYASNRAKGAVGAKDIRPSRVTGDTEQISF